MSYLSRISISRFFSSTMPKDKKGSSACSGKSKDIQKTESKSAPPSPVTITKDGRFSLSIQVKPGAKSNSITGIFEDHISLQINAPAQEGEANLEIIKFIAEILKVKKGDLNLKGSKSRQKTIIIQSDKLSTLEILSMLSNEVQKKS